MAHSNSRVSMTTWTGLRDFAQGLGFSGLGVVPAMDFEAGRDTGLESWLAAGHHGEMDWMATRSAERMDPLRWAPWARSLLVGTVPYDGPGEPGDGEAGEPRARVSRYAWGRDYHLVVGKMLVALGRQLEAEVPGARWRRSVDTGPVMEKPLARLAGLGFVGKHGNLIRLEGSSWFFIGVLATDAELPADEPFGAEHCGTCTACIDACPTGAIVEPQVVDGRRCISYLNIELRTATPPELREGQEDWVFGCDVCQDVCPWTSKRTRGGHPSLGVGPLGRGPLIRDLLALDEGSFRAATPKSAVKRARRAGLVRSAATAAGNSGDRALVPALGTLLQDEAVMVRCHAAWALGRLGGAAARTLLEKSRSDPDPRVQTEVEDALAASSDSG